MDSSSQQPPSSSEDALKEGVKKIPLLTVNAGPRDGDEWTKRLKEEYKALIEYVKMNKESGSDWFKLEAGNKQGTSWKGRCWVMHNFERYEFELSFELPATYPVAPPPLALPELDGKTEKMYRGGFICLDAHFQPLWTRNAPHFGIAHALALGLAPWLAAEVPHLIAGGKISSK